MLRTAYTLVAMQSGLHCLQCGYDLRGLPGDPILCPECGSVAERWRIKAETRQAGVRRWALLRGLSRSTPLAIATAIAAPMLLQYDLAAGAIATVIAGFLFTCTAGGSIRGLQGIPAAWPAYAALVGWSALVQLLWLLLILGGPAVIVGAFLLTRDWLPEAVLLPYLAATAIASAAVIPVVALIERLHGRVIPAAERQLQSITRGVGAEALGESAQPPR